MGLGAAPSFADEVIRVDLARPRYCDRFCARHRTLKLRVIKLLMCVPFGPAIVHQAGGKRESWPFGFPSNTPARISLRCTALSWGISSDSSARPALHWKDHSAHGCASPL